MSRKKCKAVLKELKEMTKIIEDNHRRGKEKYCVPVPKEVTKRILDSIVEMQLKIQYFITIQSLNTTKYDYVKNIKSEKELTDEIFNIVKNEVEFLKNNYYYNIVYDFKDYVKEMSKAKRFQEYKDDMDKLISSITILGYIENHEEYKKVADLVDSIIEIDKINASSSSYFKLYQLLGCKEMLKEHKVRLNDICSVSDINLKRAIYYLCNEYEYEFKFANRINIY